MCHEASTKRELDEIKEQPEGLGGTETGKDDRRIMRHGYSSRYYLCFVHRSFY